MGSLTSRPSVPSYTQPQIVRIPDQPTVTAAANTSTSNDANESSPENATASAIAAREQSLLGRERSRFGTVLTSFRGLLGLSENNATPRKTLLGE